MWNCHDEMPYIMLLIIIIIHVCCVYSKTGYVNHMIYI